MRRRDFVAGSAVSAVVWPLALRAQQPRPRVGVIKAGNADNDATTGPFLKKMEELGWVDGKNVVFDIRHYGADTSLIKDAALGLVTAGASVIVTTGFLAVRTVQAVAPNLPIVAVGGASAAPGFSLAHPGGMVTGSTVMSGILISKRVELAKEALPDLKRLAILGQRTNPVDAGGMAAATATGQALKVETRVFDVETASELADAFGAISAWQANAVLVYDRPLLAAMRSDLVAAAVRARQPLVCGFRDLAEAGCLISYATNLVELWIRGASQLDKILKGAKPADLPIEQPAVFQLTVNLKSAKALNIALPSSLLARADEVIE